MSVPPPDTSSGPYETWEQISAEPLAREVAGLHAAGRVRGGDPDHLVRDTVLRYLEAACVAAGVELGDFDRRTVAWLAGWETETAQVVIGLVSRAFAAGCRRCGPQGADSYPKG